MRPTIGTDDFSIVAKRLNNWTFDQIDKVDLNDKAVCFRDRAVLFINTSSINDQLRLGDLFWRSNR